MENNGSFLLVNEYSRKISIPFIIVLILSFLSFSIISIMGNIDTLKYLWLLPLSFFIINILCKNVYCHIPSNIGVTILIFLQLFRCVIYPLIFFFGGYSSRIIVTEDLLEKSILLMVYENICIFLLLFFLTIFNKKKYYKKKEYSYNMTLFTIIVVALIVLLIATFVITPAATKMYKTFFTINDDDFTSIESETFSIVNTYSTSELTKFSLVIHVYLMKIIRLILPLYLINLIYEHDKKKQLYVLCVIISLSSLVILDGSIARSIIYAFVALYVSAHKYNKIGRIYIIILIAAAFILGYFSLRFNSNGLGNNYYAEYYSGLLGSYFSGIQNTAATINLKVESNELFQYFMCDYYQSIPFGNTIFGVSDVSFQTFFNSYNHSYGQIPTTIGVSYLYFGTFFSPLYSLLFTYLAFVFGKKSEKSNDLIMKGALSFISISSAMAICMYYIQISFTQIFTVAVPIILIMCLIRRRIISNDSIGG